jgi:uncharacterized membrane protein YdfJ with MMPL/SSD domain
VILLVSAPFAMKQADRLSGGGWSVSGSESARAEADMQTFPGAAGAILGLLVTGSTASDVQARVTETRGVLTRYPTVKAGAATPLDGGKAALVPLAYSGSINTRQDIAKTLRKALVQTTSGTSTRIIGQDALWSNYQEVSKKELARSESIGFPIILIVLLAAFGTAVAAIAPPALGFVSVIVTGALIYLLSRSFEMSIFVQNIASMLGIGVAVDYSLFVVSRFRQELARGVEKEQAIARALASSGHAVVISGATVAASLAGLFIINLGAIRSMAVGAILVVVVSVLATVTLLPALLGFVGGGIERFRVRLPWRTSANEAGEGAFWKNWTARVLARPVLSLVGATAAMLVLASPLLAITTLERAKEQLPPSAEVRVATEEAQRLAGPGITGPVQLIASKQGTLERITAAVGSLPGVARVGAPIRNSDGSLYEADAMLASDPETNDARQTLKRIIAAAQPIAAADGATFLAGGSTAYSRDTEHAIFGSLWKMIVFILALSMVVLLVMMRSVLLPVKAVLMNLLTVGATYGVLVAVFQWGWLDWTGYNSPGYIDSIVPALVLAINFGLSMDYEVFLLTRIRERYMEHHDNDRAVSDGVVMSARIITSCALIMVGVFGAFAIAGGVTLKQLGIGLAVAVALDATIVRLVIVPSTMKLLGDWNWWLPTWLDRLLPGGERAPEAPTAPSTPTA